MKEMQFLFHPKYLLKILDSGLYSLSTVTSSCKLFQHNLSKDTIVSFSNCFLYLMCLIMIILCNTLLPNDRVHAIPADIVKKFRPKPVND